MYVIDNMQTTTILTCHHQILSDQSSLAKRAASKPSMWLSLHLSATSSLIKIIIYFLPVSTPGLLRLLALIVPARHPVATIVGDIGCQTLLCW